MSKINEMYSRVPGLVLGFHGCPKEVFEEVIYVDQRLKPSANSYDWLGNKSDVLLRHLDCAVIEQIHHIQLCITNPNCIKGYFKLLNSISGYSIP